MIGGRILEYEVPNWRYPVIARESLSKGLLGQGGMGLLT